MLACNSINSALEMFTLLIMLALLVATLLKKVPTRQDRLFSAAVALHFFATLVDLLTWRLAGEPGSLSLAVTTVCNVLTYLASPLSVGALLVLIVTTLAGSRPYSKAARCLAGVLGAGTVALLVLALLNLKTGWYYSLDSANNFTWGALRTLPDNVMLAQILLAMVLAWLISDWPRRRLLTRLLLYGGSPLVAILLENWYPTLMLIYPAVAISLLLLYMDGQHLQEERLLNRELELANSRTALVLSQVQPHFLYNALNTIYYLCGKEPKTAQRAIDSLADYLRGNLDTLTQTDLVPFSVELNHIDHYLELEKLRYDALLQVEKQIETESFLLPAMTVQPLVENAVKHGLGQAEQGGTVRIATRELPDCFEITVQDDGVGFDTQAAPTPERSHVGTENVSKRLWMMCHATLQITSAPGQGTTVTVHIPK